MSRSICVLERTAEAVLNRKGAFDSIPAFRIASKWDSPHVGKVFLLAHWMTPSRSAAYSSRSSNILCVNGVGVNRVDEDRGGVEKCSESSDRARKFTRNKSAIGQPSVCHSISCATFVIGVSSGSSSLHHDSFPQLKQRTFFICSSPSETQ